MRTKLVFTVTSCLFLTVIVGGCGSSHRTAKKTANAETFVKIALASQQAKDWGIAMQFPKTPVGVSCVIHGGGFPPGLRVPGTCTTLVKVVSSGGAVVRFVESWDASLFHGPGSPSRGTLSHTWELKVASYLVGGPRVIETRDYGDFPPQMAR